MNIQIFALKRNFDVQKAERYFKERKIPYQFIDLTRRPIAPRELQSVRACVPMSDLVDMQSAAWKESTLAYMRDESGILDALCQKPALLCLPIVRNGKQATVGYRPAIWGSWT